MARICSVALGMEKKDYDPGLDVEKHWQFLELPEVEVREGFAAFADISQRGDISMYWKMHAVFPDNGSPFLCLNPIQYTNYYPQEQEFVERELRELRDGLDKKKPPNAWRIRNHLKWAIDQIEENPMAQICRYPKRDKLSVAMSCQAAVALDLDSIAFPTEETLKQRWPDIKDGALRKYGRLKEYAKTSRSNLSFYEFTPDLELKAL